MAELIPKSQRFTKAALAERDRLSRHRQRLHERRLQLDAELEALDQEIARLEEITGAAPEPPRVAEPAEESKTLLKGSVIRELAVPILIREGGDAAIHYRAWLDLLRNEGYEVAGKRPEAVFLNQVSRSPLVRATTQAGYYAVDLSVVDRLKDQLHRQQVELAKFLREAPIEAGEAFEKHSQKQREMLIEISRTERELEEAEQAIDAAQPQTPQIRVVSSAAQRDVKAA